MNDRYASVFANGQTHLAATASQLLAWYDSHRRSLPWRARPGEVADPYRVWLSEIMLQQTTVAAAKPYFERFLVRFPDVMALAEAPLEAVMQAWAGLGYYSRARNLHACAKVVAAQHGGVFPGDEAGLIALPGIGPYTAAAITSISFGAPTACVPMMRPSAGVMYDKSPSDDATTSRSPASTGPVQVTGPFFALFLR